MILALKGLKLFSKFECIINEIGQETKNYNLSIISCIIK